MNAIMITLSDLHFTTVLHKENYIKGQQASDYKDKHFLMFVAHESAF